MQLLKLTVLFLLIPILGFGQSKFQSDATKGTIQISGTSSLHEWEEEVTEFKVTGTKNENVIESLEVQVKTKSIDSGKSIMDDKTYEALQADKYPYITLKATNLQLANGKIVGKGQLQLAGKTNTVTLTSEYKDLGNSMISIKGSTTLKMTDFGIDPPTAMFGTLLTGDEVTITYELKLN